MKRFLCMLCCLAILFGIIFAAIPASAEQIAESGSSSKIYFDAATTGWSNYEYICCFLWDIDSYDDPIAWGSKKGRCTNEGDGIWSFDFDDHGISLYEGGSYYVMFSSDWNTDTYPLLIGPECFGDTAYVTGNTIENPADSSKWSYEAKWKNADSSQFGPVLMITSIGNVTGSVVPPCTSRYLIFVDFLQNYLENARMFSGKDDQMILDDTAKALGLDAGDVERAVAEAGVSTDWDRNKSSLPDSGEPHYDPERPQTAFDKFCHALVYDYADLMYQNPGKTDQQLIDMLAEEYGMYQDDVERALSLIGAGDVGWSKANSTLPAGLSGYQYTVGGYYLVKNYKNGETYVDENYRMTYDENSGYYYIYAGSMDRDNKVSVVRFNENRRFTIESESSIIIPRYNGYLFFFRPEEDGYNFGFNYSEEYYSNMGYASGSGGISGSIPPVDIAETTDETTGVRISWMGYSGAAGYEVFKETNGEWSLIGKTSEQSFIDTSAQSGNIYQYTVTATDASGKTISMYPGERVRHRYIGAPKITGFENTADGVLIHLDPVFGNARYRIYVRDGLIWKAIGDTYGTSFLHKAKATTTDDEEGYPLPSEDHSYGGSTTGGYGGSRYTPGFYDVPAEDGRVYNYRVRCVSYDGYKEIGAYYTDAVGTQYNAPKPQYLLGDVDGDKVISVLDATKIQKVKAKILSEKDINTDAADVDGDGVVSVIDATRIQKFKAQICNLDGSTPYRA